MKYKIAILHKNSSSAVELTKQAAENVELKRTKK